MVQWLRLDAYNAENVGSTPGLGNKTPHMLHSMAKKKIYIYICIILKIIYICIILKIIHIYMYNFKN